MHPILLIILVIICVEFSIERILDYLNLRYLDPNLPEEARGIYDEEKYRKSQEYYKTNHRFSQITSTFSFLIMICILIFGGFGWLDEKLHGFSQNSFVLAAGFFGIIGFASDLIGLPFSIYQTFVIEERFGFNKTTVKTFIFDKLKGYLISILVGGSVLFALIWIYQVTQSTFWLWAWLVMTLFMVFATMFYASVILPLFNKLSPLEAGDLRAAIETYSRKAGFDLTNIYVMDGSKRSSKANAFFTGLGRKKKIVLFDTLIKNHTVPELVAVLAHEIGHYKLKHTRTNLMLGILQTGLMLFILSFFLGNPELGKAMGSSHSGFHLEVLAFGMLYSPLITILGILMNMISRKFEFQADAFAGKTFNGADLATALKKLSVDNLSNLKPHPAYVFVHYSHPTLLARLAALQKI